MKLLYAILFSIFCFSAVAQSEVKEITWEDLTVKQFEEPVTTDAGYQYAKPVFSEDQSNLDGQEVIISGNYHVLNNFGSKSYLLSRDEIIKTPMQGDEVVRLIMEEDPEIYFGRTVKIKGVLHIDENPDSETIYYMTNIKKVKNTGTVEGE